MSQHKCPVYLDTKYRDGSKMPFSSMCSTFEAINHRKNEKRNSFTTTFKLEKLLQFKKQCSNEYVEFVCSSFFFLGFHSDRFRLYLQFTITGESSNGSDTYTVNIISFLAKLAELSPPLLRTTLEHSSLKNKFVLQRPYEASFVSPFPEQHHHGSINEVFSLCMSERLDEYYSSYELIKQCCKIEFYTRI